MAAIENSTSTAKADGKTSPKIVVSPDANVSNVEFAEKQSQNESLKLKREMEESNGGEIGDENIPSREVEKVPLTKKGIMGDGVVGEDFIYDYKLEENELYRRDKLIKIPDSYQKYESEYEKPTPDKDTNLATINNADDYLKEATKYANDAIKRANQTKKLEDIHATAPLMREAAARIRDLLSRKEIINNRSEKTRHNWIKTLNQMLLQAERIELQTAPAQIRAIQRKKTKTAAPKAEMKSTKMPRSSAVKPPVLMKPKNSGGQKRPGPPGGAPMLPRPRR